MSSAAPKVSFTIRRPTSPVSRATYTGADSDNPSFKVPTIVPRHLTNGSTPGSPLARSANASPKRTYTDLDSSDEDDDGKVDDELVTGFDRFGVQRWVPPSLHPPPPLSPCSGAQLTLVRFYNYRKHEKKKPQGPLVIPALKDRDWRELARKRRAINRYVPASAKAQTGADGSVGGLGTTDTINSGPQLSGIQIKEKRVKVEEATTTEETIKVEEEAETEETDDQKAIRALLSGTDGVVQDGPIVDVIPQRPVSETDAYRQDVQEFPDEATLDDYARVPVSQFGAALLRGMGWKEGVTTNAKGKKQIEPWLPTARPALLGIGAKEQEVLDDGSGKGKGKKSVGSRRPEKRYVPLVKKERDGSGSGSGRDSRRQSPPSRRASAPSSRRGSRSPSPRRRHRDREYDDRKRDYGNGREKDRDRDRETDSRRGERREYDRDRDRRRDRDGDRRDTRDRRDY